MIEDLHPWKRLAADLIVRAYDDHQLCANKGCKQHDKSCRLFKTEFFDKLCAFLHMDRRDIERKFERECEQAKHGHKFKLRCGRRKGIKNPPKTDANRKTKS